MYRPPYIIRRLAQAFDASRPIAPTVSERHLVLTGFMLGVMSIFTSFFPICGVPIAIAGLIIGLFGRRIIALQTVAMWSAGLSVIGLVLSLSNLLVSIGFYLSAALLQ